MLSAVLSLQGNSGAHSCTITIKRKNVSMTSKQCMMLIKAYHQHLRLVKALEEENDKEEHKARKDAHINHLKHKSNDPTNFTLQTTIKSQEMP